MTIYFSYFILVLFGVLYEFISSKKIESSLYKVNRYLKSINKNLLFGFMLYLPFLFIATCRSSAVGEDLKRYLPGFLKVANLSYYQIFIDTLNRNSYDIGYLFFTHTITLFTENCNIFLSIHAIFATLFLAIFIFSESRSISLSILLLISFGNLFGLLFCTLRQIISIAIVLFASRYIWDKKPVKFAFCILVASSFHFSAICTLVMYPLGRMKIDVFFIIRIFCLIIIFALLSRNINSLLVTYYTKNDYSGSEGGSGYWYFLILLILFAFIWLFRKQAIIDNPRNIMYFNIFSISLILQIISIENGIIVRFVQYFSSFCCVLVPNVIFSIKDKTTRGACLVGMIIFCFVMFINNMFNDLMGIVPYVFFWS